MLYLRRHWDVSEPVVGFKGMSGRLQFVFAVPEFKKKKGKRTEKFSLLPKI